MTFTPGFALPPRNIEPLTYRGPSLYTVPCVAMNHAPTPSDKNFPLLTMSLYTNEVTDSSGNAQGDLWYLAKFIPGTPTVPLTAEWRKLSTGSSGPLLMIATPFGTSPVAPNGLGLMTFTSSGGTITITGNQGAHSINFDLAGGGLAIDQINVDAHTAPGTDPVVPDGAGQITITGAQVATGVIGTNVIRTDSLAANTFTIEIQRSTAVAGTDLTKNGVSHYNNAQFSVDANGFVSLAGGGTTKALETLTGNSGGAVAGDANNNINILGSGNVTVAGNPGTNTLTISSTGINQWNVINQGTQPANFVVNNGYICQAGGTGNVSIALPTVSALGDMIEIVLDGATSWTITQGLGQSIRVSNSVTTVTTGSIVTTGTGDAIRLVCETANTRWVAVGGFIGNLTIN